ALRTLMYCAVNEGKILRRRDIALAVGASENHLAQVIHLLGLKNYIVTMRGRAGGITLARPAKDISVGHVFAEFERVLPYSECIGPNGGVNPAGSCPLAGSCRLTCILARALDAFYSALNAKTIADLVDGNQALETLLAA